MSPVKCFAKSLTEHIDNLKGKKYSTYMDAVAPLILILAGLKRKFTEEEYDNAHTMLVDLTLSKYPKAETMLKSV